MSTSHMQELEKSAWVFKQIKEDDSTIENYSPDKKAINEMNEDGFDIEYLHCMIEGNFKINQELNKIILNSERVFTNQENLFDPKSLVFQIQQKGSIISFPKGGVFNTLLKIEDQINLKLNASNASKKN